MDIGFHVGETWTDPVTKAKEHQQNKLPDGSEADGDTFTANDREARGIGRDSEQ